MLKLFKTHLALVPAIIIMLLIIILRIDLMLSNYSVNLWQGNLAPFSLFLKNSLGPALLTNKIFNLTVSAILVFFQAGIIISIFEQYKNNDLKSFLPAWLFVLIMHLHPDLLYLNPPFLAFTFILLAFRKLIIFIEHKKKQNAIFDIALFIGIASMFWLPSIFFLLFVFYFLVKKSKLNLRIFLSLFFTVLIPLMYVFAYYIVANQLAKFYSIFNAIKLNDLQFIFYTLNQSLSSIMLVAISLLSLYFVSQFVSKQLMQIKHLFALLGVFILNVFLVFLFQNDNQIVLVCFIFFPVAVFLSILFNRIKRNIFAEFIHLALLLSIIINFMNFS